MKKLVDMHGGTIEAHSAGPGLGSDFTVTLPCAPDEAQEQKQAKGIAVRSVPDAPAPAVRRRILIVDDNTAAGLELILRHYEHEVVVVHDGPSALTAADRFHRDVVLLDIGLPGMSGFEVARRLREWGSAAPLLVATTGYGQVEDRRRAAEAGFDHHLTKPVDVEVLVSLIRDGPPHRDDPFAPRVSRSLDIQDLG